VRSPIHALLRHSIWTLLLGAAPAAAGELGPLLSEDRRQQVLASLLDHARIHVSARLFEQLASQPQAREFPVENTVLGVPFSGHAKTESTTRVTFVPHESQAVFDVILTGVARSKTTGRAGPVCIHCEALTRFIAAKRFALDDAGLTGQDVRCHAETHSTVTGISSDLPGLRGRIATRFAWRRSDLTHDEADRISAENCEADLARLFDERMAPIAELAGAVLESELLRGGSAGHPARRKFQFRTTRDYLYLASVPDDRAKSPQSPPEPNADTLAKLWLPTTVIDLPLALAALQSLQAEGLEKLWRELAGQALPPRDPETARSKPALDMNFAVEPGWLSLSMRPQ
jgi:hypothetical protein